MMKRKTLICFGTRPEAIKMAPLIKELKGRANFTTEVCVTAQHRQMLDQVLEIFMISPDYDLDLMSPNQTLNRLTSSVVTQMAAVLQKCKPDLVVVQGDTTTTFASALAAFYARIPVAHLEAGLRTYHRYSPFPEEMNRVLTSALTSWHFPPTQRAAEALLKEGHRQEQVFVVGNTVIDALLDSVARAKERGLPEHPELQKILHDTRFVLITGHRRENFGTGFQNICAAIGRLAREFQDIHFVYPVHLNPNVKEPVHAHLGNLPNVHLIRPLDYLSFVWLMDRCTLTLTDSGGVQEEAPSLGKPVLVMRETTERPEAVEAGVARLVGTDPEAIFANAAELLTDEQAYAAMSRVQNPYGDGTSAKRVADVLDGLETLNEPMTFRVSN